MPNNSINADSDTNQIDAIDRPIGVFDSGIGGLSVLAELTKSLPYEDFYYYGDTKNSPYGDKSQSELEAITSHVVKKLISEHQAKLIVVACNTATTRCIDFLRAKYPQTIFVGTEPAIKQACESGYHDILMLGTPATVASDKVRSLIAKYQQPHQRLIVHACLGLASAIECHDDVEIEHILQDIIAAHSVRFDAVILGCTHYILIRDHIQSVFSNSVLIDGNQGVARQVTKLLRERHLLTNNNSLGKVEYEIMGN